MKIISLLATLAEWNDLAYSLRSAPSNNVLKKNNLNFTCLRLNKVLNIYNPRGLKLLTRFRLGFIFCEVTNLIMISMIVLIKFVFVEYIPNLRTISSSNIPFS